MTRARAATTPGRATTVTCPGCGNPVDRTNQFCGYCGTRVHAVEPPRSATTASGLTLGALGQAVAAAVGTPIPGTEGAAQIRARLAAALLDAGRLAEAETECVRGLSETSDDAVRADLHAVRASVAVRAGCSAPALAAAWTAVVLRGGPVEALPALAAAAALDSESGKRVAREMLDQARPADDRVGARLARYILLAGLGRIAEAVEAVEPLLEDLTAQPAAAQALQGVDVDALEESWRAGLGAAVGAALGALLRTAVGAASAQQSIDAAQEAGLPDSGEAARLRAALTQVRADLAEASGDTAAAVAALIDVAQDAADVARFDRAVAALERAVTLDPGTQRTLWFLADYRRCLAGAAPDPDVAMIARARAEWERSMTFGDPPAADAWAHLVLGGILDVGNVEAQPRTAWQAVQATLCGLLLDADMPQAWGDLARLFRQVEERPLAAHVLAVAIERTGAPEAAGVPAPLAWARAFAAYEDDPDVLPAALDDWAVVEPDEPTLRLLRAIGHLRDGHPAAAVAELDAMADAGDVRVTAYAKGLARVLAGDVAGGHAALLACLDAVRRSAERNPALWAGQQARLTVFVGDAQQGERLARRWVAAASTTTDRRAEVRAAGVLAAAVSGDAAALRAEVRSLLSDEVPRATMLDLLYELRALAVLRPHVAPAIEASLAGLAAAPTAVVTALDTETALQRCGELAANGVLPPEGRTSAALLRTVLLRNANRHAEARDQLRNVPQAPAEVAGAVRQALAATTLLALGAEVGHDPGAETVSGAVREMAAAAEVLDPASTGSTVASHIANSVESIEHAWALDDALHALATSAPDDAPLAEQVRQAVRGVIADRLGSQAPQDAEPLGSPLVLELGSSLVPPDATENWQHWGLFTRGIPAMKQAVEADTGVPCPAVRVRDAGGLVGAFAYRVLVHDVPTTFDVEVDEQSRSPVARILPDGTPSTGADASAASPPDPQPGSELPHEIEEYLDNQVRRWLWRLTSVDEVELLIRSWCDEAGTPVEERDHLLEPAALLRATVLVCALIEDRVPVRGRYVLPVLTGFAFAASTEGAVDDAVAAIRAGALGDELGGRARSGRPVEVPDELAGAAMSRADPGRLESLLTEFLGQLGWTSGTCFVVGDPQARVPIRRLLRQRLPDVEVFTAAEMYTAAQSSSAVEASASGGLPG